MFRLLCWAFIALALIISCFDVEVGFGSPDGFWGIAIYAERRQCYLSAFIYHDGEQYCLDVFRGTTADNGLGIYAATFDTRKDKINPVIVEVICAYFKHW